MPKIEPNVFKYENYTLGPIINQLILDKGVSKHMVARQAGLDPSYLTRICLANRPVTRIDILLPIFKILELSDYQRTKLLWEAGIVDKITMPASLSEEVFTMLAALKDHPQSLTSSSERTNHKQTNQQEGPHPV